MDNQEQDEKPVVQSRWVKKSRVERYTKEQSKALDSFVEQPGWHRGARVQRVRSA